MLADQQQQEQTAAAAAASVPPPPPEEEVGFDDFEESDDGAGDYYFRGEEDDDDDDYERSGGRRNNDRSPLNTLKKKNSVIRTMKMVSSSFKGLKKSPKHQEKKDVVLFDSYPSLDFDVNNLDDTAEDDDGQEGNEQQQNDDHDDQHADDENGDTKEQSEQEKDINNGHGDVDDQGDDYGYKHGDREIPAQVDEMARETSTGSNRSSSRSNSNRSNSRSDRKRDIGQDTEQQHGIDDEGYSDNKPHAVPSHQADSQKEHHRHSSETTMPKPPRPRKASSLVKVPPAPQMSPPTSSKRSPLSSSSRKSSSSLRKRSSGGGSSYNSPVKTSPSKATSPGSNSMANSPRVSFQNPPPFTSAESPTASTKSSVESSAVGDASSLPNIRPDHTTTNRNGGVEGSPSSNKGGTEESWKRLSDAFAKTDGCMDGYFSKLQEKAGSAIVQDDDNEDPARLDRKEKGGTKSRIKKLFSLAKSPKSSSSHKPKPKNVAQKLQSDDPNVVMEELTSMLSPGHTTKSNISPPNRTKSLKLERPIDDEKSEAPSVDYPEIPTEKIISLNDIRKDVTSNAPESSDYIVKPMSVGSLTPNEVSWRRERTPKKTTSEYKSPRVSPGTLRSDPYRRSSTRIHASRRIRSSSDDGLDSSGKSRRKRSSSNDGVDPSRKSGVVASAPGEGFDSPGKPRRKRSSSNDAMGSPDKPRLKRSSSNDGMNSSGNPRRIRSSSNDGTDRKPRSRRTFKIDTKNEDDSGRKDASVREKPMSRRKIKIDNKDEGESTEAEISSSGRDKPRSRRTVKVDNKESNESAENEMDSSGREKPRSRRTFKVDNKESNESAENEMDSSGREKPRSRRTFKVDKDEDESAEAGMNSSGREKAKSRRTIKIDEKHRDETDENGSPRKDIEASGLEKSSTSTPHRRHRTSKLHDKPSPRQSQEGKPSEHSHSSRRRHGVRRSSANDDADDEPPTPNKTAESSGLRRKTSRRVEASGTENGNTASQENDQLSKSKPCDHPSERPDSSGKTHSGHRQHGSSGSSGRRSLVHHDANATSKISASSHSTRRSNDTSPEKRHRHHGHRRSGGREATNQSDIKSPIFSDSDRGTSKSSPTTKLKSLFTDDMALDYSHTKDNNDVPHPIEKPDKESAVIAAKVEPPRNFSSPPRSKSTSKRPDLRSGLVRSFSLNNMGRSASVNPFGGRKRWSQLDSLEEQSIDGSSLVEPSSELFIDTAVDKMKSSSEPELPVIDNTNLRSGIENGSQIDDEYEDELAPLKEDVPRSSLTLGEALDRGSEMHGRLFDDDGQQTVITDDGSLWLNEDGTDAVAKIRSSASVCAPQLDFGAPAGVRNVQ